jgi:hypothetical protein
MLASARSIEALPRWKLNSALKLRVYNRSQVG